jgi:hypothetical protein
MNKSHFKKFLSCPNEYWLDHHFPEAPVPMSLNAQFRREIGYEVERHARTLPQFASGNVAFGKEFDAGDLYAKADIVVTDDVTGEIAIYEVKSGASAKEDYQIDLAFQCHVATEAGYVVGHAYLITVDTSYVFDRTLDALRLLRITDETDTVNAIRATLGDQITAARACLTAPEPEVTLNDYCKASKLECRFIARKFPDIPEYNVSHIFNAGTAKLKRLLDLGILNVCDIPADFEMTERESAIVEVERSGQPLIVKKIIRDELAALDYPLNFLDYETFNPAVPKFSNTRPYQQMVFQYSLHTLDKADGELRHSYHLSRNEGRHPTEEIVERLHEDLAGRVGRVIIWSEGFEKSRNTEMGVMYPMYANFLEELNDAVYDLRKVFSRRLYMHPGFRGSSSIKNVLPVLRPELSYDEMEIGDGVTASIKWYHMATRRGDEAEQRKIYDDLCAYCHLDTLAMVKIFEVLREVTREG